MNKKKRINVRAFVSVLLFFLIIILLITAVMIEIVDHIIIDHEILIEISINHENQFAYFPVKLLYVIKRVHAVTGYFFAAFSVIHIVKNWKALKGYIKKEKNLRSIVSHGKNI